jgi:hypothetical protein
MNGIAFRRMAVFALAGLWSILVAASAPAFAGSGVAPVNKSLFGGVAIDGYDPVAYFVSGKPVKGSRAFEASWHDATWRFASKENRDRFVESPGKFAPQFGGYCAYAVSQGTTAKIDPDAWKIVDAKLYLNLNKDIQAIWEQDIPGYIRLATENWPKLLKGQ